MPAKKRLTMRQLRTLLRLKHAGAGLSDRTIACQIGVARSTIQEYLARVEAAGLSWPLPDDLTDEALDRLLFPRSGCRPGFRRRLEPDWAMVARELKRAGGAAMTLWGEHWRGRGGACGWGGGEKKGGGAPQGPRAPAVFAPCFGRSSGTCHRSCASITS